MIYVHREHNLRANILSELGNTKGTWHNHIIVQETLAAPNIEANESNVIEAAHATDWMTPITHHLKSDELPHHELKAKIICKCEANYTMVSRKLYKMGKASPC